MVMPKSSGLNLLFHGGFYRVRQGWLWVAGGVSPRAYSSLRPAKMLRIKMYVTNAMAIT